MPAHTTHRVSIALLLSLLLLVLGGCTTIPGLAGGGREDYENPQDPWEGMNRSIHSFNDSFDRNVAQPVARGYQRFTHNAVDEAITNFFSNLDDVMVFVNDLLQLKPQAAATDLARVGINTTIGLFGLFDVATKMGLEKNDEDFGQTLGYWGVGSGPYLVLPFLGPSTLRDGFGRLIDYVADPDLERAYDPYLLTYSSNLEWGLLLLYGIDTRADLLYATNLLEQSGTDPYVFMRETYLQKRQHAVYDGQPPMEKGIAEFNFEGE